jgi:hypothetical protein
VFVGRWVGTSYIETAVSSKIIVGITTAELPPRAESSAAIQNPSGALGDRKDLLGQLRAVLEVPRDRE